MSKHKKCGHLHPSHPGLPCTKRRGHKSTTHSNVLKGVMKLTWPRRVGNRAAISYTIR